MKTSDYKDFHEGISGVMAFYNKNLSKFELDTWWAVLKQYNLEAIQEAFSRHLANTDNGQFFPKPADIIRMLEGSTQDTSLIAWTKVDNALRSTGTYSSICFDDPLINKVLHDMGGWIPFGTKSNDEWPFVAKEFQTRYRGYKSRSMIPDYPSHLIGMAEAHNTKEGFKADPPNLIGDIEKAKQVLNKGAGLKEFRDGIGLQRMQKDITQAVGSMQQLTNKNAA